VYTRYTWSPPARASVAVEGVDDRFPVRRIFCVGRNYADHVREMGGDPKSDPPVFFTKPADAIVASGSTIAYAPRTTNLHHEVELVVALKSGGSDIAQEHALSHVFGYAVGNDLTRRDLQHQLREKGLPWDMAKAFDAAAQIGAILPAERFGAVEAQAVWLEVNGQKRQQSQLSQMIWSVPEIIQILSSYVTLAAGDLIYTGTPDGVGSLERGDAVRAGIDGLPPLEFRIAS
jgi:fumarylpyruvate hydrolase